MTIHVESALLAIRAHSKTLSERVRSTGAATGAVGGNSIGLDSATCVRHASTSTSVKSDVRCSNLRRSDVTSRTMSALSHGTCESVAPQDATSKTRENRAIRVNVTSVQEKQPGTYTNHVAGANVAGHFASACIPANVSSRRRAKRLPALGSDEAPTAPVPT